MTTQHGLFQRIVIGVALALSVCLVGWLLSTRVRRPLGVPVEAVSVPGISGYYWQWCTLDDRVQKARCVVANRLGERIYDEYFVGLDKMPITKEELVLTADDKRASLDRICLRNGRVLIPTSLVTK